ncbi:hypothetical protein K9N68_22765 [Kovacikia minuta CCNUW1]|uniref:hypothetical protein n=1 Tax=Kovacikia minuta TaxID=2931930 RepID=UPI001CCD6CB6|nr:hypothetical protein [Kovacikia minuta]UBF24494.1 hypothetical protein K9N68_22765 [Kovacikia minuta CCNUW1]
MRKRLMAIAVGVGVLAAGAMFAYWYYLQQQWCVQFTANGGQEVTYSRGCYNPERYKKWTITATTDGEGLGEVGSRE